AVMHLGASVLRSSTPVASASLGTASRRLAMACGTWTPILSSFAACGTTSRVHSARSERLDSRNGLPFASKAGDEATNRQSPGSAWLRRGHRGRHRIPAFLGDLLVFVCPRQPQRT